MFTASPLHFADTDTRIHFHFSKQPPNCQHHKAAAQRRRTWFGLFGLTTKLKYSIHNTRTASDKSPKSPADSIFFWLKEKTCHLVSCLKNNQSCSVVCSNICALVDRSNVEHQHNKVPKSPRTPGAKILFVLLSFAHRGNFCFKRSGFPATQLIWVAC